MNYHQLTFRIPCAEDFAPGTQEVYTFPVPVNVTPDWGVLLERFPYMGCPPDQRLGIAPKLAVDGDGKPVIVFLVVNVSEETFARGAQVVRVDLSKPE